MKEVAYCFPDPEYYPVGYIAVNHVQKDKNTTLCGRHLRIWWREMTGDLEEVLPKMCLKCKYILRNKDKCRVYNESENK